MLTSVSVGDVVVHGQSLGGRWTVLRDGLVGWHGSAEVSRERFPAAQGSHLSPFRLGGRPLTVSGHAVFADPVVAKAAGDALVAAVGSGRVPFTVVDSAGTRTATVELDGRVALHPVSERMFTWSVPLYAPDPLKYGPTVLGSASLAGSAGSGGRVWPRVWPRDWGVPAGVVPGGVAVSNAGKATYWPTVKLTGPVTNPVVACGSSWVRYGGVIPAGQSVTIDAANREVWIGSGVAVESRTRFVSWSGDWLAVPPGDHVVSWVADDAQAAAVMNVWSYEGAWL